MDILVTLLSATFAIATFTLFILVSRTKFIVEMFEFISSHYVIIRVFYMAWPFIFSSHFRQQVFQQYEGHKFLWIPEALLSTILFVLECIAVIAISFWVASDLLGVS